jgi:hypothetical protein
VFGFQRGKLSVLYDFIKPGFANRGFYYGQRQSQLLVGEKLFKFVDEGKDKLKILQRSQSIPSLLA